jgi:hypothetical protein
VPADPTKIKDIYEERYQRDPEFRELVQGPGQHPMMRKITWSHVTDEVKVEGPVLYGEKPERPL